MTAQIISGIRQLKPRRDLPAISNKTGKNLFTTKTQAIEQDATYRAALELVAQIDEDLTRRTRHYRNRRGILLTCLDEVVLALLNRELLEAES